MGDSIAISVQVFFLLLGEKGVLALLEEGKGIRGYFVGGGEAEIPKIVLLMHLLTLLIDYIGKQESATKQLSSHT